MTRRLPAGEFFGATETCGQLPGLTLVESTYPPGDRHPKHAHEHASFCMVLEGAFAITSRNASFACRPSSVLFYPAGEEHAEHFHAAGGRCLILELKSSWLARLDGCALPIDSPAGFHGGPISGIALRLSRETRTRDEASALAVEGLTLELIAESLRSLRRAESRAPTRRIEDAREFLRAHFAERVTLAAIAAAADLHPVSLAQGFRKAYGCSVGEYVRQLRVEFASHMLVATDAPLSQIATDAGFFDQSHFTRTFKRLTGMTPAEYRTVRHRP